MRRFRRFKNLLESENNYLILFYDNRISLKVKKHYMNVLGYIPKSMTSPNIYIYKLNTLLRTKYPKLQFKIITKPPKLKNGKCNFD